MIKYLVVFKLAAQDVLEYKLDFFLSMTKYALMILMMSFVWGAVEKEGNLGIFTQSENVRYFFFAAILYSVSNFHPWYVEEDIKFGFLSKYLVKPISPNLYYIFYELARTCIETIVKFGIFVPLLYILKLQFSTSLTNILLFFLFFPFIFLFSFQALTIVSTLSFWITEAYAIRWGVTIIFRFLAGLLVPMVYFPLFFQKISFWLPFQHLAFTPIQIVQGKVSIQYSLIGLIVLISWTIVISIMKKILWQKGIHEYEGTGI